MQKKLFFSGADFLYLSPGNTFINKMPVRASSILPVPLNSRNHLVHPVPVSTRAAIIVKLPPFSIFLAAPSLFGLCRALASTPRQIFRCAAEQCCKRASRVILSSRMTMPSALNHAFRHFKHHFRHLDMPFRRLVKRGTQTCAVVFSAYRSLLPDVHQ